MLRNDCMICKTKLKDEDIGSDFCSFACNTYYYEACEKYDYHKTCGVCKRSCNYTYDTSIGDHYVYLCEDHKDFSYKLV